MREPLWRSQLPAVVIGLLDVFAIGFGMGVPIFAILLGFPVGWYIGRRQLADLPPDTAPGREQLRSLLGSAGGLAAVTFVVVLVVWGSSIPNALDPSFDVKRFGIPLILYGEQASMIGWLALMIVISPALQFMAVLTGGIARLALKPRRKASAA